MSARRQPGPARNEQDIDRPFEKASYGARINQLFQEAMRDLEALKQSPPRPKAAGKRASD